MSSKGKVMLKNLVDQNILEPANQAAKVSLRTDENGVIDAVATVLIDPSTGQPIVITNFDWAALAPYIFKGSGSEVPANTSLYDALTFQNKNVAFTQATPTQNEWYTVLDTIHNAKLDIVEFRVADTAETIEIEIIIDGYTLTLSGNYGGGGFNATANTVYFLKRIYSSYALAANTTQESIVNGGLEARSVRMRLKKTTANGTGTITCNLWYGVR